MKRSNIKPIEYMTIKEVANFVKLMKEYNYPDEAIIYMLTKPQY